MNSFRRQWWKPALFVILGLVGAACLAALLYGLWLGVAGWSTKVRTWDWDSTNWLLFCAGLFAWCLLATLGDIKSAVKDAAAELKEVHRQIQRSTDAINRVANELFALRTGEKPLDRRRT